MLLLVPLVGISLLVFWLFPKKGVAGLHLERSKPGNLYHLRTTWDDSGGGGLFDGTLNRACIEGEKVVADVTGFPREIRMASSSMTPSPAR